MMEHFTVPEGKEPTRGDVLAACHAKYDQLASKQPTRYDGSNRDSWVEFVYNTFHERLRAAVGEPLETVPYDQELPDYGDLMPVDEWLATVKMGGFIDYDGHGAPAKAERVEWKDGLDPTKYPTVEFRVASIYINPSSAHLMPKDATHIVWFNR